MSITRRTFGTRMAGAAVGLALALSGFAVPANSIAAEFPEKPVTLVVWAGAGGALDTYGRKLAELLEKEAGWTVKVDNRPGGSGAVGVS